MAVVKEDIIQGNTGRKTISGWEFSRVFTVSELTVSGAAMLVEAVTATGVAFGDPHPTITTAYAIEFDPRSRSEASNIVDVVITYKEFSQNYQVNIGTHRQSKTTNKFYNDPDVSGGDPQRMKVYYTFPSDYILEDYQSKTLAQGAEIGVDHWFVTFSIERTEFTSISADSLSGWPIGVKLTGPMLTDRMREFNNHVNKASWNLRPSDSKWVWRLRMSAASAENGLAYRVKYEFSYDPNQWNWPGVFRDPATGEPVADPVIYDGTNPTAASARFFPQFLAADFSLLELQ